MATFNGNEGAQISLADAAKLTSAYRTAFPTQPKAYFFGGNNLKKILRQLGCKGIRVYFGVDTSGKLSLVLVGANAKTNDQVLRFILDEGQYARQFAATLTL